MPSTSPMMKDIAMHTSISVIYFLLLWLFPVHLKAGRSARAVSHLSAKSLSISALA